MSFVDHILIILSAASLLTSTNALNYCCQGKSGRCFNKISFFEEPECISNSICLEKEDSEFRCFDVDDLWQMRTDSNRPSDSSNNLLMRSFTNYMKAHKISFSSNNKSIRRLGKKEVSYILPDEFENEEAPLIHI